MNFLAHLYLSGDNEQIIVGNFIGDFVKGRNALQTFDPTIALGIELHRAIDQFTDTHPVVRSSKDRLRPKYRHYAGVIVDIFYDHFLARKWNDYHKTPLPEFAQRAYAIVKREHDILPAGVQYMLPYMISGNWLVSYASEEGIRKALSGMARRTTFSSKLDEAVDELRTYYPSFQDEFVAFFEDLRRYCADWLDNATKK